MTMHFSSLRELALQLVVHDLPAIDRGVERGLDKASALLQRETKKMFGTYQQGAGPFEAWPELADSTKEDRVKQGYSENDPLLREGDLRDSIEREVEKTEAIVGSTSEIMPFHEFGTSRMPPRPVFGIALYRNWEKICRLVGHGAVSGFVGYDANNSDEYGARDSDEVERVHKSLGYNL